MVTIGTKVIESLKANTHVEKYLERICIVTLEIGDLKIFEEFNVLLRQIYNIILGKNWLHMAICDYGLDS